MPRRGPCTEPLRSCTGVPLTREVTFTFALEPTRDQQRQLLAHAGAARFAFNHHLARVKANLDQRVAERTYGVAEAELTPSLSLSWSTFSFINEFNAWKNGQRATSPSNDDGTRGLSWRAEVSADVFECASVNAAQALANFSGSRTGKRAGKTATLRHQDPAQGLGHWVGTGTRPAVKERQASGRQPRTGPWQGPVKGSRCEPE